MIDGHQLTEVVIRPALEELDMWSQSAENLILGTCAQESALGLYLKQIKGPALSIFQIEEATYNDIWRYLAGKYDIGESILSSCNCDQMPEFEQIGWDLRLATMMCRIKYWMVPESLPDADDIEGLAAYWKKYYNTELGKGTEEEFIANYERYVQ